MLRRWPILMSDCSLTDEQADRMKILKKTAVKAPAAATGAAKAGAASSTAADVSYDTEAFAAESELFAGVNLGSLDGLLQLRERVAGKSFLKGAPSKEDAAVVAALSGLPTATLRSVPEVLKWYATVTQFSEAVRSTWR